jgi:hypothetical protein
MKPALMSFAFLLLVPLARAQVVPVAPFAGDAAEGFESQPVQNGVLCLESRIFGDRADLCARSGPLLYVANGFGGSGTIFSHSGMQCSFSGQGGASILFDAPVQSFGGWFGTISSVSGGTARFFDVNGNVIGTQPISATACTLNCGWTWNGWHVLSGPLIKRVEVGAGAGSGYGLALDDLVALYGSPATGVHFCGGDGSSTVCPCINSSGTPAQGCSNSIHVGGYLAAGGNPSLSNDTVVLYAENMGSSTTALHFQGTTRVNNGLGAVFGDGLRCAGGSIVRLGVHTAVNGTAQFPGPGDSAVHVRGQITAPGSRTYQVWYRDTASFCTSAAFNLSNGFEITWAP